MSTYVVLLGRGVDPEPASQRLSELRGVTVRSARSGMINVDASDASLGRLKREIEKLGASLHDEPEVELMEPIPPLAHLDQKRTRG
jgi:hypothetical protein